MDDDAAPVRVRPRRVWDARAHAMRPPAPCADEWFSVDLGCLCKHGWAECYAHWAPAGQYILEHISLAGVYAMHGQFPPPADAVCCLGWRDCDDPCACARLRERSHAIPGVVQRAGDRLVPRAFIAGLRQHRERRTCALGYFGCFDAPECARRAAAGAPPDAARQLWQHRHARDEISSDEE